MKPRHRIFLTCCSLLLSARGHAIQGTQGLVATAEQMQKIASPPPAPVTTTAVPQTNQPTPVPSAVEVATPSTAVPAEPMFRSQFGIGFAAIPAYQLWFVSAPATKTGIPVSLPFMGGAEFDFLFRASPHLATEITLSGTGAKMINGRIVETNVSAGIRVYPVKPPYDGFHFAPYFSFGIRIPLTLVMTDSPSIFASTVGFGAQIGVGFDFRINRHAVLFIDVRGITHTTNIGALVTGGSEVVAGVRASAGFHYYF